ncbi:hypothetical protein VP01_469g2 [Puccinia sorghi]|uniref:HAT C-terminal dimerisation domain-containing protein n=1 Tax=Puccinia sorghi TaxID=27349 RepID=A0A0L6UN13_9BASI|nr:hypothetical protein VP01_469g2 [Puccinia sorghi]
MIPLLLFLVFALQSKIFSFISKQNCKMLGHFKEIHFTKADWMQVKHLNDYLKPFNFLTKEMEGDKPSSSYVLANYCQMIKDWKKKEVEYQEEAIECEALDHSKRFPVLFSFAKDYLASSASSCAAEQTFFSAASVFSSGHGSLKPWTIERCVSSHMWLKQGI